MGGVHCHLLFNESNGDGVGWWGWGVRRGRGRGKLREAQPPVQSNGGLCGRREHKLQDRTKSKEIDLLDPVAEREAALPLSSFPKGPDLWATLNKQNSV